MNIDETQARLRALSEQIRILNDEMWGEDVEPIGLPVTRRLYEQMAEVLVRLERLVPQVLGSEAFRVERRDAAALSHDANDDIVPLSVSDVRPLPDSLSSAETVSTAVEAGKRAGYDVQRARKHLGTAKEWLDGLQQT